MYSENNQAIPQYIIEGFARMVLPKIQEFYETDEGKAYLEKWKTEQETSDEI